MRPLLIRSHQPRITGHISGDDRGKAAGCSHSSGIPTLRRSAKKVVSSKARVFSESVSHNPPAFRLKMGIVNLAARGMLVASVARRLGSEGPLLAYCAAAL